MLREYYRTGSWDAATLQPICGELGFLVPPVEHFSLYTGH